MATLTFSFNTGTVSLTRITDAICARFGYKDTLPDGTANPEIKSDFAKRMVKQQLVDLVLQGETKVAREAAEVTIAPIVLT